LKKACAPVEAIDEGVRALAMDMLATMYDAPGIGLAAPQVGVMKRSFVMDCAGRDALPQPRVLINPQVTWASDEANTYDEGCLSIPEIYEDVTRPARVRMRWTDLDGSEQEQEFDGLEATCVQHELDHLNGRLFIDNLSLVKR